MFTSLSLQHHFIHRHPHQHVEYLRRVLLPLVKQEARLLQVLVVLFIVRAYRHHLLQRRYARRVAVANLVQVQVSDAHAVLNVHLFFLDGTKERELGVGHLSQQRLFTF